MIWNIEIATDGDPAPAPRREVFGLTSAVSRQLLHAERTLVIPKRELDAAERQLP